MDYDTHKEEEYCAAVRDKNRYLSALRVLEAYPYKPSPVTENDALVNAQYEYLMRGDRLSFGVLWSKFRTMCYKMINTILMRKHKCIGRDNEEDAIECAAEYVMKRYSKWRRVYGREYVIRDFTQQAKFAAMHALWSTSERDMFAEMCNSLEGMPCYGGEI